MKNHWATPDKLMRALAQAFQITTEWFASPLNRSPHIPRYASAYANDAHFDALHDAYSYKWTGSGQVNPEYEDADMCKAVKWAVASTYEQDATLNILVLPDYSGKYGFERLLQHPHVHVLCCIPPNALSFQHPFNWTGRAVEPGKAPFAVQIVMVANALGLQTYYDAERMSYVEAALRALRIPRYNLHLQVSIPVEAPTFHPPKRFGQARLPPQVRGARSATQAHLTTAQLRHRCRSIHGTRQLRFDSQQIVYTDGSKRGSSVTAASDTTIMLRVQGQVGQLNNNIRAELAGIHRALHHVPLDTGITLLTDSLTGIQMVNSMMCRPEHMRFHKHKPMLSQIMQRIACRTAPTNVYKVRAHLALSATRLLTKQPLTHTHLITLLSLSQMPATRAGAIIGCASLPRATTGAPTQSLATLTTCKSMSGR